MRYLSVCSGIEAATVAWHGLGWTPVAFSEIEKFPSQVLAHHYPDVPNLGDMTKYKEWNIGAIDLLVGGTPCQSFSVAGLRKGLEDPRGNLALVYCGILDHFRPKWCVWENVPGVLSSNGGRDFGSFLGALAELGYGFAYRVLDAQYFGVAQRRRRVFVVGHLGDWQPAAQVLFESESLRRDSAPSREKGERVAPTVVQGAPYSRTGNERVECDAIVAQPIPYDLHQVTAPVNRQARSPGDPCHTLAKQNAHNAAIVSIQGTPLGLGQDGELARALNACNTASGRMDVSVDTFVAMPASKTFPTLLSSTAGVSRTGNAATEHETYIPMSAIPLNSMTMQGRPSDDGRMGSGIGQPGDPCPTITKAHSHAVAQPVNIYGGNKRQDRPEGGFYVRINEDTSKTLDAASGLNPTCSQGGTAVMQTIAQAIAPTLTASNDPSRSPQSSEVTKQVAAVHSVSMAVRRLTPVECERLQGFPDNYTNIKENCPDGPRYKALGNSMAVPVMQWIGGRINAR